MFHSSTHSESCARRRRNVRGNQTIILIIMKIAQHSSSLQAIIGEGERGERRGLERGRECRPVRELETPFLRYLRTFTASLLRLLFPFSSHAFLPQLLLLPYTCSSLSSLFRIMRSFFLSLAAFANFRSSNFRGKNYVCLCLCLCFQIDFFRCKEGYREGEGAI